MGACDVWDRALAYVRATKKYTNLTVNGSSWTLHKNGRAVCNDSSFTERLGLFDDDPTTQRDPVHHIQ